MSQQAAKLIGIARMAAEAPRLDPKRRVQYFELPARSYLARCDSLRVPFRWTINPYRGCEFGCKYCYARYTHEFMELRDPEQFERKIYVKAFDAKRFKAELDALPVGETIALGTAVAQSITLGAGSNFTYNAGTLTLSPLSGTAVNNAGTATFSSPVILTSAGTIASSGTTNFTSNVYPSTTGIDVTLAGSGSVTTSGNFGSDGVSNYLRSINITNGSISNSGSGTTLSAKASVHASPRKTL